MNELRPSKVQSLPQITQHLGSELRLRVMSDSKGSKPLLIQVWFMCQQHPHHLGTYKKCRISGPFRPIESESEFSWGPQVTN